MTNNAPTPPDNVEEFAGHLAAGREPAADGPTADPYATVASFAEVLRTCAPGSLAERVARSGYRAALAAAMVGRPDLVAESATAGEPQLEAVTARIQAGTATAADVWSLVALVRHARSERDIRTAHLADADRELVRLRGERDRLAAALDHVDRAARRAASQLQAERARNDSLATQIHKMRVGDDQ